MAVGESGAKGLEAQSERQTQLLVAKIALACGIGSIVTGGFDGTNGLLTSWDHYGITLISALYIISSGVTYRFPKYSDLGVLVCVISTCIYHQGIVFLAVHQPSAQTYYSAASSGSFYPIIYLACFIAIPKYAVRISWLHCLSFYVQFVVNLFVFTESSVDKLQDEARHLLVELMMSHPIYILALSYIVRLRDQIHATRVNAHQEKEQFLGMLSHEIRGLMQNMVYAIDLLGLYSKNSAAQKSLKRLENSSSQLQQYLLDIGELTKLENPSLSTNKSIFDSRKLLEEIEDEWSFLIKEKGLGFKCWFRCPENSEKDGGAFVFSDQARLRQVLSNLISNALKYTPEGEIEVGFDLAPGNPNKLDIMVKDSGIGVDSANLEKIFEPYVRLDKAISTESRGSGLGLTIVRQIVLSLGGAICVESNPDHGTCFRVSLPC